MRLTSTRWILLTVGFISSFAAALVLPGTNPPSVPGNDKSPKTNPIVPTGAAGNAAASRSTEPSPVPRQPTTKPVVYIASPYSRGDAAINTHFQCQLWDKLMD